MANDSISQSVLSSQPIDPPEPLSQISDYTTSKSRSVYRPARALPYELQQHCITFIEEGLYLQAISLLQSLLIAGSDNGFINASQRLLPAYVPSPQIVALAATLTVHPSLTTRAVTADQSQAANDALYYLNQLNGLAGPLNAQFHTAFQFASANPARQGRRRARPREDELVEAEEQASRVQIALANESSIWNQAEDFWHVVGWAFNCSVHEPKRWARWKLWLDFMIEVLHRDLDAKVAEAETEAKSGGKLRGEAVMAEALLSKYLVASGEGRTGKRRVLRAILADGGKKSLAEFGKIWKNETKEKKESEESYVSQRARLNFDEGDYGDYMDVDEDEDEEESQEPSGQSTTFRHRSSRQRAGSPTSANGPPPKESSGIEQFGGMDSILLRQRFVALLFKLSVDYENTIMDSQDLLALLTEFLRPLPLSVFVQFVLPSSPYIATHAQASLNQNLLRPLLSADAPTYNTYSMTQKELEKHFLPFASSYSGFIDNARVSILVEGLFRMVIRHLDVQATGSLKQKLEKGIVARHNKARGGVRRKAGETEAEDALASIMLEQSAARLRLLLDTIKT